MKELDEYVDKELSTSSLDTIDKLTHSIKNLCKVIEKCENDENYSANRGRYNLGMTGSYMGGGYGNNNYGGNSNGMSYRRGRYSRSNEMISDLYNLRDTAPDEETRMEFDRFIRKMESM